MVGHTISCGKCLPKISWQTVCSHVFIWKHSTAGNILEGDTLGSFLKRQRIQFNYFQLLCFWPFVWRWYIDIIKSPRRKAWLTWPEIEIRRFLAMSILASNLLWKRYWRGTNGNSITVIRQQCWSSSLADTVLQMSAIVPWMPELRTAIGGLIGAFSSNAGGRWSGVGSYPKSLRLELFNAACYKD